MSFGFLNAVMLLGLAGAALPVLVHLLSRRKYDIVHWGAMQFLELGRRTRRRIRLEELLLLLLRIGLVCLLAAALARPWAKGSIFSTFTRSTPRDIAVVIDGSYSMGWEGGDETPHAAAVQWTHELIERLQSGDTVTLLDARDRVRVLGDRPTSDFSLIRQQLDTLPSPSGTSSMPVAAVKAAQALTSGEHLDRDIILLTDDQSLAWSPENGAHWRRFDETVRQSSVPPRVWAVDVANHPAEKPINYSVDRLSLSRELTVPGFPMRIEATVRQWGGSPTQREVSFAVNGQRLSEKTVMVNLPPNGEATITFEHRFNRVGSYVVSVMLGPDHLPGDNSSDAAVVVANGIPVLLVDGNPSRDPTQRETFFINAALTPSQSDAPWVMATVVDAAKLAAETIEGQRAVFLADVPRLSAAQGELLEDFVTTGGGLVVAPGDRIDADAWNQSLFADGRGLLPARFGAIKYERDYPLGDVNIDSNSLEAAWLARFRTGNDVDLTETRFAQWWQLTPAVGVISGPDERMSPTSRTDGDDETSHGLNGTALQFEDRPLDAEPVVVAKLDSGDPLIVARTYGEGAVLQWAAPLDADWSTLPSKNDFVPLMHEMVFHLASRQSDRNVEVGMPLTLSAGDESSDRGFEVSTPDGRTLPVESFGLGPEARAGLRETDLPGVYRFQRSTGDDALPEYFVVHSDRRESDLAPISPPERERIAEHDRVRFVSSIDEIVAGMADDQSPTELWRTLLLAVLVLLVAEVLLTRRLVQGGHEAIEETPAST